MISKTGKKSSFTYKVPGCDEGMAEAFMQAHPDHISQTQKTKPTGQSWQGKEIQK
ncbi:MAG: hypothetical protein R6T99_01005 [Bacteroidales bacterium]